MAFSKSGDISNFVDQICQINKNRNIIDNMKSNRLDPIAKFDLDEYKEAGNYL